MFPRTSTPTSKRLVAVVWLCAAATAAAAAAATARCPQGCRCSADGLSATCSGLGDQLPQGLSPTLSTLAVTQHRLRAVDGATFADLPQLQVLDVSRGRITQVSDGAFRGLRQLRQLVLSDNWLTSLPEDAFPDSLEQLDVSRNPLSLPAAGPFLRADGITRLNLSHCAVTTIVADAFTQLPSLVELDLRGNPVSQLMSPLTFLGLRQLIVDEGSLGVSTSAVMEVVQDLVQVPRLGATLEGGFTTERQLPQGDSEAPDPPNVYDDPETTAYNRASEGQMGWQRDTQVFNEFSSLFGPVPQDGADSNLFRGAPFQATGEVTVVYASDLKNLKNMLLVLSVLAVMCFLLAAVQRALDNARARGCLRTGGDSPRGRPCHQNPDDADNFWWDTETAWWEAGKPRGGDLPPPYPYPPTYDDSLTISVTPNPNYDGQADNTTRLSHQPASVHLGRRQPDLVHSSHLSQSTNA